MSSKTLLNHPYFSIISWTILMAIGHFFLYWNPIQILFFFYLEHLIQYLFIGIQSLTSNENKTDTGANFIIISMVFLMFTFFSLFSIYWANPWAGKFFDYIVELFVFTFNENIWMLLFMFALNGFAYYKFTKLPAEEKEKTQLFGAKWFFKILAVLPFIALIALIFNGAGFMMPTPAFILVIGILCGFEIFWIKYQKKHLKKNQL